MSIVETRKIFAHRGSSGTHPENTMVSFQAALEAGADGLECDVQLSKDGVPVIIHDEKLKRTTGEKGWVDDYTWAELRNFDAGSWFDPSFRHERIPSLEQVLAWAGDNDMLINLEIKSGIVIYDGIEECVLNVIRDAGIQDRVIISSFNHYSLSLVRQLNPDIQTAVLYMEGLYKPWEYARELGANALHCYYPAAKPAMIRAAAAENIPVRPFTVNRLNHMRRLWLAGCESVITDWPEKAYLLRQELEKEIEE